MIKIGSGAVVECIAPSSAPSSTAEKDAIVAKAAQFLSSMGLVMRYAPDTFSPHPLYANTDEYRAQALVKALTSEESSVIWPMMGGYGASVILSRVHELLADKKVYPKLLIGFSDITAIHTYIINRFNWPTLHWELFKRMAVEILRKESIHTFECIIKGKTQSVTYEIMPMNSAARKVQKISSKIFGGNLSVLSYSTGTFWGQVPHGAIIFLEDINEHARRISVRLEQLLQAGYFSHAQAIIIGCLSFDARYPNGQYESDLVNKSLSIFEKKMDVPMFRVDHIGHVPYNRPLPLNTEAVIEHKENGSFMINVNTGIEVIT